MTRRSMCMTAVSQRYPPALTVCLCPVEDQRQELEVNHLSHRGTSPSPLYRPDPAGPQGGCHFLPAKKLGSESKMGHLYRPFVHDIFSFWSEQGDHYTKLWALT